MRFSFPMAKFLPQDQVAKKTRGTGGFLVNGGDVG